MFHSLDQKNTTWSTSTSDEAEETIYWSGLTLLDRISPISEIPQFPLKTSLLSVCFFFNLLKWQTVTWKKSDLQPILNFLMQPWFFCQFQGGFDMKYKTEA